MSSGKMPRMSSGQPGLQKSVVREVEGRRARIVEGSRSRNVEPANIGLINLKRNQASQEASSTLPLRRLSAVTLDIDSAVSIPSGKTAVSAQPGTTGTIGFHPPE
ncbi:hypothetical protein IWW34DRAFT_795817 [Fusarium oxysporum f. sp. albedinis]|nr:hypothetical protein IWW34DRAFT_795817 [Fusarium oxysporum f. sp. albedinis]